MNLVIVDRDLGFVFWLGRALDLCGHVTLPARSGTDALSLIDELGVFVDALLINPAAPGAVKLIASLRLTGHPPKVICLIDDEESRIAPQLVTASVRKPTRTDGQALEVLLWAIHNALASGFASS